MALRDTDNMKTCSCYGGTSTLYAVWVEPELSEKTLNALERYYLEGRLSAEKYFRALALDSNIYWELSCGRESGGDAEWILLCKGKVTGFDLETILDAIVLTAGKECCALVSLAERLP